MAMCSAALVCSCGVLPILFNRCIHFDRIDKNSSSLKIVLSFAVGCLLGDVWLHLLPEAWAGADQETVKLHWTGLWVIIGLVTFMAVEKSAKIFESVSPRQSTAIEISGYLNLIANCTDNFTHGLAIAASYTVSPLVGLLTTLAIMCHEIPHEIGDFAILLRSGFTCPDAARAQLVTSTGGFVGVVVGLSAEHLGQCTSWMLPFTGGGFLYISLVSIVPQLLREESVRASLVQVIGMLVGIAIMIAVTVVERKSCSAMPGVLHV